MKNLLQTTSAKKVCYLRSQEIWENVDKQFVEFDLQTSTSFLNFLSNLNKVKEVISSSRELPDLEIRSECLAFSREVSNKFFSSTDGQHIELIYRTDKDILCDFHYVFGSEWNQLCDLKFSVDDFLQRFAEGAHFSEYDLGIWDYLVGKNSPLELREVIRKELRRLMNITRSEIFNLDRLAEDNKEISLDLYHRGLISLSEFSENDLLFHLSRENFKDVDHSFIKKRILRDFDINVLREIALTDNEYNLVKVVQNGTSTESVVNTYLIQMLDIHKNDEMVGKLFEKLIDLANSFEVPPLPLLIKVLGRFSVSEKVIRDFFDVSSLNAQFAQKFTKDILLNAQAEHFCDLDTLVKSGLTLETEFGQLSVEDYYIILSRLEGSFPREKSFERVLPDIVFKEIATHLQQMKDGGLNLEKVKERWLSSTCFRCQYILKRIEEYINSEC